MIFAALLIWDGVNSLLGKYFPNLIESNSLPDKYFPNLIEWWGIITGLILLFSVKGLIKKPEERHLWIVYKIVYKKQGRKQS